MLRKNLVVLSCVLIFTIHTDGQGFSRNYGFNFNGGYIDQKYYGYGNEVVKVKLFYEALCPACRQFDTHDFKQTVLELGPHLDIELHPYGNAQTISIGYGGYDFKSQHGPDETYGNKLHACAIQLLPNITTAVLFNSCMMENSQAGKGSDDAAADVCGRYLCVNSDAIKQCAKSSMGTQLLKYHGDVSNAAGFKSVPTVIVNGVKARHDHFKEDVCKAFRNPPPQCCF